MVQISNSPVQTTILRLQARKSFALGLWIQDKNERPLDISDCQIRLVIRKTPIPDAVDDDSGNLITSSQAEIIAPGAGYARFNIQASELDEDPGTYYFSIVLSDSGYTSTIVGGECQIEQNMEFTSTTEAFDPEDMDVSSALRVVLRGQNAIKVTTGATLAPGTRPFTQADRDKLDILAQSDWRLDDPSSPGAILHRPLENLVPDPHAPNQLLKSWGSSPGKFGWAVQEFVLDDYAVMEDPDNPGYFLPPVGQFTFLNATGAVQYAVPMADGANGWGWQPVQLPNDLDDVPDSDTRLAMTPEERDNLASLVLSGGVADWEAEPAEPGYIQNKPTLGTAAAKDEGDFLPANATFDADKIVSGEIDKDRLPMVSEQRGWKHGTAAPTTGTVLPGEVYLKHS